MPNEDENISEGIVDEVVNIIALQFEKQMVLCKKSKKRNNYIFLLPKISEQSDFRLSENGEKILKYEINPNICTYVAQIEYLPILGRNRAFWQTMYDNGEFELWDIDNGPMVYFGQQHQRNQAMLLCILRVYEMPFSIKINNDFIRGPRGNAKITNLNTLRKIQNNFGNGNFKPVIDNGTFNSGRKKIQEIVKKSYII